ncbi:urease accessory protein UreD [Albirhodobacter sp. R86504]|uniref:urease accessory protein UreD n=1 Tax=Albirhodobacter sp. R86504 TaxID=3093848 RepID=UPI00366C4CF0
MLDRHPFSNPASRMQRARGEAFVGLVSDAGRMRLTDLRQAGSAKAMLPRVGTLPEVVFLNTSGGLTGGDEMSFALHLGAGGRAVATTQTAERAYRASEGAPPAIMNVHHKVGAGAWLDWLPQETILYEASSLARHTIIDLEEGAGCMLVETVVLGRAAMGETLETLTFSDRREVRRKGKPVLIEPLHLDTARLMRKTPAMIPARAFATLAIVGQGAEDAADRARSALTVEGVTAAVSGFDGKCIVRMMAADGWPLRRQILALMGVLRRDPMPRVWQI